MYLKSASTLHKGRRECLQRTLYQGIFDFIHTIANVNKLESDLDRIRIINEIN